MEQIIHLLCKMMATLFCITTNTQETQYPKSVSWSPQIERVALFPQSKGSTSMVLMFGLPAEFQQGRSGGFAYEVIGSGSYAAPTAAGQTRNASKTFSETGPYGSRSLTLQFTFTSVDISGASWHGQTYGWNNITAVSITGQTGLWKENTEFIAEVTVSSTNPFGAASPVEVLMVKPLAHLTRLRKRLVTPASNFA